MLDSILLLDKLMSIGLSWLAPISRLFEWYNARNTNWGEIPVTRSILIGASELGPDLDEKLPEDDTDVAVEGALPPPPP